MIWLADIVRAHCSDGFYSIVVGILLKSPSGFTQKFPEIYSIVPEKVLNFIYLHKSLLCRSYSRVVTRVPLASLAPRVLRGRDAGGAVCPLARPRCNRMSRLMEVVTLRGRAPG